MTIYMLAWDNGLDWDDALTTDVGAYSTEKKREEAEARYRATMMGYYPFCSGKDEGGKFVCYEIEVDEDFFVPFKKEENHGG